jgi:hypothetical protein
LSAFNKITFSSTSKITGAFRADNFPGIIKNSNKALWEFFPAAALQIPLKLVQACGGDDIAILMWIPKEGMMYQPSQGAVCHHQFIGLTSAANQVHSREVILFPVPTHVGWV